MTPNTPWSTDDLTVGIKSTAILFGQHDRLIIGLLQTTFLILMVIAGDRFSLHMPYYAALVGAAALCVYHQYLIREREPDACFKAFLHNNWAGAVIFAGLVLNFAL